MSDYSSDQASNIVAQISAAGVAAELRRCFDQEFSLIRLHDGQVLHDGGVLKPDDAMRLATRIHDLKQDKHAILLACSVTTVCLVIPLSKVGLDGSIAVGVFHVDAATAMTEHEECIDAWDLELSVPAPTGRQQSLASLVTIQRMAELFLEKLAAEMRLSHTAFQMDKSRFLANLSHEFRTPLAGIVSFARMLMDGAYDDEAELRENLATISQCADRMVEVVDDILEFSQLETGHVQVQQIHCRLDEVLMGVVSQLQGRAAAKGLNLEARGVAASLGIVYTDPGRLKQMLAILVRNAIKFTDQGGVTIESRLDWLTDPSRTASATLRPENPRRLSETVDGNGIPPAILKIDVVDSGVGISANKLASVLHPFVQADESYTRLRGGLGLGLAICRRIAQSLGGDLSVQSEVGKGSRFTVALPLDSIMSDDIDCDRFEKPSHVGI